MATKQNLEKRRAQIISEMDAIRSMRVGSIYEQTQKTKLANGKSKLNGPYTILTSKNPEQKTQTKRILPDELEAVALQLDNYHRFKELSREYTGICVKLAEMQDSKTSLEAERTKKN